MSNSRFKVFLPAPSLEELRKIETSGIAMEYKWSSISVPSADSDDNHNTESEHEIDDFGPQALALSRRPTELNVNHGVPPTFDDFESQRERDWMLPPATLEAVGNRLSELYKNVIFGNETEEENDEALHTRYLEDQTTNWEPDSKRLMLSGVSAISWPPTDPQQSRSHSNLLKSRLSLSRVQSEYDTQDISASASFAHTSSSSIASFPTFSINLNTISSLSALLAVPLPASVNTKKVNLVAAVMEVDGPETVKIKKGKDAGKEVGLLKLIVSDGGDDGMFCKLTAWRETADTWGGGMTFDTTMDDRDDGVRRGDVVHLENVLATLTRPGPTDGMPTSTGPANTEPILSFSASPQLSSRMTICYRTLPTTSSDSRFRPDLRLAASDPGVKFVAAIVQWFAQISGIETM